MNRRTLIHAAVIPALVLAASQSGGCGGGSGASPQAPGALSCLMDLQFTGPIGMHLTADLTVTCDFPVASSTATLTIQHIPLGGGAMDWQRYDDPKISTQIPPLDLTYIALCSSGSWEAVATIDGVGPNSEPFNQSATQALLAPLTDEDCTSS